MVFWTSLNKRGNTATQGWVYFTPNPWDSQMQILMDVSLHFSKSDGEMDFCRRFSVSIQHLFDFSKLFQMILLLKFASSIWYLPISDWLKTVIHSHPLALHFEISCHQDSSEMLACSQSSSSSRTFLESHNPWFVSLLHWQLFFLQTSVSPRSLKRGMHFTLLWSLSPKDWIRISLVSQQDFVPLQADNSQA